MIEVEIYRKALEDLKDLEAKPRDETLSKISKLKDSGLSINEVSPWEDNNGEIRFRLKVKEENTDHRVFFDIENGKAVIYGIFHRDEAYETSVKKELNNRID